MLIIFSGCRSTRYLKEGQALVTRVTLDSIDKQFKEQAYLYVQSDIRPNSKLNLTLYNFFNTRNGEYRTDRIRNIGEEPNLLDSAMVEISRKEIEKFLASKGFLKAKVKSEIEVSKKRAHITFTAAQGPEFKVRNITYQIDDPEVAKLYEGNRSLFTHLTPGRRFDADSLSYEREQVYQMMKRNGYYDYLRQYVRFDVDTNLYSSQADLKLLLANPEDKPEHPIYTIADSYITIKNSDGRAHPLPADSAVIDSQYHFADYSKKFEAGGISEYIFVNKGDKYNISRENLTYDRLYELNVFKNIKIEYRKTPDSTNRLNPWYEIVPLKRMSNRIEGEYTFNSGRNGFNVANTFSDRNVFGGAEQLEIKARYGVLFDAQARGNIIERVFNRDLQLGARLIFPRLITPFPVPVYNSTGIPHTTFSTSFQSFEQKNAFSNRTFINSVTYDWAASKYKFHSFTPLNLEYRNGRLDPAFKNRLRKDGYELYIRTNDRQYFNLGSLYSFTYNAVRLNTYSNFIYFRGSTDLGGNTLGLVGKLFNFKRDNNGFRTIFKVPYIQYVKGEVDIRSYRYLGGDRQFVSRISPGIGYPYGNNRTLPFEKNFFAGGSSGVRAWQARTLGPGNYNRKSITDSLIRANLRNLDQLGEIKFESNLEYRFKLLDYFFGAKVRGAVFTDFGNIWRIRATKENPGGEFKFNKLFDQLAIGSGGGLRFDLDYFVLRFDAGVKVKDPQFTGSGQWVIKDLFNQKAFKNAYRKTNSPDNYRFVIYNFGIGLPF